MSPIGSYPVNFTNSTESVSKPKPFSEEDWQSAMKVLQDYHSVLLEKHQTASDVVSICALSCLSLLSMRFKPSFLVALVPMAALKGLKIFHNYQEERADFDDIKFWMNEYLEANEAESFTEAAIKAVREVSS